MMKLRFGSALVCLTILSPLAPFHAQEMKCSGPSELPPAGVSTLYCHNGRMGFAVTEFAPISQAARIPHLRAVAFAKREAELKARVALARFLSDSSLYSKTLQSESFLDSTGRSEWENFLDDTNEEAFRARLKSGIVIIANETRDGAVYVTAATTPDFSDLSSSINR